ncbi:hypothetical protein Barb4_02252 [Bacteroidales bacterium Barb4]|nr:hypothetical protein Barb4_02252 [Bacteroidales bacterium Barb4]
MNQIGVIVVNCRICYLVVAGCQTCKTAQYILYSRFQVGKVATRCPYYRYREEIVHVNEVGKVNECRLVCNINCKDTV